MSDLDVIKLIEKQIAEPLKQCEFEVIMSPNSRCSYAVDSAQQVIGLNLQSCKQTDLALLGELKQLIRLNLSLNQLTKLTPLKELTKLTQLNLQKNTISEIAPLKRLVNLTALNLQDNQISELRPLKALNQLTVLNLQANQVKELRALSGLTALTMLNLGSNQITNLKDLSYLSSLKVLNLSSNQITELEGLKHLFALIELDLRFNQISNLQGVHNLINLTRLYLSSNKITDLTPLAELSSLTLLHLNANQITEIESLQQLNNLVELDLRANKISQIKALANLNQLTSLHLENNQIADPSPLKDLTQLTLLNLRTNQISTIETLRNLKNLTQLYLSSNQIKILPRWIIDFNLKIKWNSGGDGISVTANPLKHPPPEIIRQGNAAIKDYFDKLEQQQQRPLNEVKICVVGDKGVGKTSLCKLLQGGSFNPYEPQTNGITITEWKLQNLMIHLWDFGGNENIQVTHSLFFSKRCLYIVVLDNSPQRNEEEWLKKIEYHAGDVPVLIVLNKCEQAESYDVNRRKLIKSYNSLQTGSFFSLSCAQNLGVEEFKQGLQTIVKQLLIVKTPVPESWLQVKQALQPLQKQQPYLSLPTYQQVCVQQGVKEVEQQQQLAQLLHDAGGAIYFKKNNLAEIYLLNPDWLIKSLYKIMSSPSIIENKGFVLLKDLVLILKSADDNAYEYSVEHYRDLINFMRSLELCFLLDKTAILIPQLLDIQESEIEFEKEGALRFRIYYQYLNAAIMPRLIVALHNDIENRSCWRTGVLLKNDTFNCSALIKVNYQKHAISIQINGEQKRHYFAQIKQVLQDMD
jgi:small GTP-binding protein